MASAPVGGSGPSAHLSVASAGPAGTTGSTMAAVAAAGIPKSDEKAFRSTGAPRGDRL